MATHTSILAWRIPWTEEPGGLQSTGSQGSDTTMQLILPRKLPALLMSTLITAKELDVFTDDLMPADN